MATDAEEQEQKPIKKEQANANNNAQKPKPDSTVILERKKAPNRLVVGANFRFLSLCREISPIGSSFRSLERSSPFSDRCSFS